MDARSGDRVVIGPDEVIDDDLYVAANEVIVDGTINGDLVAVGNRVEVNGTVRDDVIAAGQSVKIGGRVGHTARIAGQALLLSQDARVDHDLVAAGFSLQDEPNSRVGGSLAYAGSQALLEGTVDEDLNGAMNGLELRGSVGRNMDVHVDGGSASTSFLPASQVQTPTVAPGLTMAETAQVGGNLNYESSSEAQIIPGAQIGGDIVRTERPPEEEPTRTALDVILDILRNLIALLLVGLLVMLVAPNWTRRQAHTVADRPLASLGWGALGFIVFVALEIVILLVTILLAVIFGLLTLGSLVLLIIGLGVLVELGLGLAFWILTGFLAQIVVSFLVGIILVEAVRAGRGRGQRVLPLAIGLILYVILRAIPVLGFIVGLVVVLLGFGALCRWIWTMLRRSPAEPPA